MLKTSEYCIFQQYSGFDFSTVYKNIAIQAEYGEISKDNDKIKFGTGPSAFVMNTFLQFDNFNVLMLYRNYDLDYDNPYQRSFSNYQRYKTSILEDYYWLNDPVYAFLHTANPQPQAEEGIYDTLMEVFKRAEAEDVTTHNAASKVAEKRMSDVAKLKNVYLPKKNVMGKRDNA